MCCGIPVITIDKFGAKNIVNNKNGWLYSGKTKNDYIYNIKTLMENCIENPELIKEKGINSLKSAKENDWSKKIKFYSNIYENL